MRSLDIGATGMMAQQLHVDVISENIANMTTTGFKRQRPEFKDLMYQNIVRPGTTSSDSGTIVPAGLQLGLGVRAAAVYRIHEQGTLQLTENPLDLALNGDGFFQIEMPDGTTGYTRDGVFQVNQDGEIVNTQGYRLQPGFTVPSNTVDIQINEEGQVFAKISGQVAMQNLGQIQVANFINPAGLAAAGDNMLLETEASGAPVVGNPNSENFASVRQGAIENSNVNVVEEITRLITAQRAYELNSQVISTSDDMLATITQLR
jgi:flagellar basal-body rod protein FlgG